LPASPLNQPDDRPERVSVLLHGMALNALFPPPPRLPADMICALEKIDRQRR
jgi:hypothetical protein